MKASLSFAFFGSSLVSAYWNGAATYYRGILRALAARGHRITFYEPDAYDRQKHRDIPDPPWAEVVVYRGDDVGAAYRAVEQARGVDVLVKASGVGVFDRELEAAVVSMRDGRTRAVFWDVDAPATLERMRRDPADSLRGLVPKFDEIFTYGGGDPVVRGYRALGARRCVPIYNAVDPDTHYAVPAEPRFSSDLGFLGNRLPDREARVEEFFWKPARALPGRRFLLGGSGWDDRARALPNVTYAGHVGTSDHNAFNSTPRVILNVARDSMARYGYSPATRIFEAAGAAACIVTDAWEGVDFFLEPGLEILVASSGEGVSGIVENLRPERARRVGEAARRRVLAEHTYARRAGQLEAVLLSGTAMLERVAS